jgi:hypothetical protein
MSDESSEMDIGLDLQSAFSPTASSKISSSSHQCIRGDHNVRMGEKGKIIRMPIRKSENNSAEFYHKKFYSKVRGNGEQILRDWESLTSRKLEAGGDMFLRP